MTETNCERCIHFDVCDRASRLLWARLGKEKVCSDFMEAKRWIPVTERLPDRECIAIGYQNEMLIGYISKNRYSKTGFSAEGAEEYLGEVTHWMPLPEPPKEG